MQLLVKIVLFYMIAGFGFLALARDNPVELFGALLRTIPSGLQIFTSVRWWTPLLLALVILLIPRGELAHRLPRALIAVFLMTAFSFTFSLVKTAMPFLVPFWADPLMASIDEALHFGHAPWEVAHRMAGWIDAGLADVIYHQIWTPVAVYFPVFLILLDNDQARIRRYVLMHAFAWVVLGNVMALAFMSGGPVFHDRIVGGDAFAGIQLALTESGLAEGNAGQIQTFLWNAFVKTSQSVGTGISAFPSVHLAMSSLIALYLFDRWRGLLPVSVMIVATYLFLSIYLGWHYAFDGYVSVIAMTGFWAYLRKREARAGQRVRAPEWPLPSADAPMQPAE
jgi:PAP2 superfamily